MQANETEQSSVKELIKMGDDYRDGKVRGYSDYIKAIEYYCLAGSLSVYGFKQAAKSFVYLLSLNGPNIETKRILGLRFMEVQFKLFVIDRIHVAEKLTHTGRYAGNDERLLEYVIHECCIQNGLEGVLEFPFCHAMKYSEWRSLGPEDYNSVYMHFLMACHMITDGWMSYFTSVDINAKVQALLHIVAAKMIIEKVNPNHDHIILFDLDRRLTLMLQKLLQSQTKEIRECAEFCQSSVLNESEDCVNVPAYIRTQLAAYSYPACLLNRLKDSQLAKPAPPIQPQDIEMKQIKPERVFVPVVAPDKQKAINFIDLSKRVRKDTTTFRFVNMLTPGSKLGRIETDDQDIKSRRNSF